MNILENFSLNRDKEDYESVITTIEKGVVFKGTNLWILVFAIFIASLGLNVNSTAVIIGAMLVSPIMGPIIGLGMGMAINDLALLRKSLFNYLFAAGVGLATSTIYFLISPLSDEHSEILARTAPNIYDVLIAFFGGLAGIFAISSKHKGNVIPGVAIATALMPPLCTAGFGLATLKFEYFFGAFYLFLINTVFIALATLITARFLKFPYKHLPEPKDELKAKRMVGLIVLITLLPSIYFGYDIVQRSKFLKKANAFIETEAVFPNDYLLKKTIDAKKKTITLIYGGEYIDTVAIEALKSKLPLYSLEQTSLNIRQGFAYLKANNNENEEQEQMLNKALAEKENQLSLLKIQADSINGANKQSAQIYNELKVQYPSVKGCIIQKSISFSDTIQQPVLIAVISSSKKWANTDKIRVEEWLKIRMNSNQLKIFFEQ